MMLDFFKYHGLGNDFIIVDALDDPSRIQLPWPRFTAAWCDRRTGIGADGILVICPANESSAAASADLGMRIFNSDGSEAQMCGNGIRCIAKYMIEHRSWQRSQMRIQTGRGCLEVSCSRAADGSVDSVTVNMGEPILHAPGIPVRAMRDRVIDLPLSMLAQGCQDEALMDVMRQVEPLVASGSEPSVTCISMGNPHAVVFVRDVRMVPLETLGPVIETLPAFPERTNIHFVEVRTNIAGSMRTWERGAGATSACGTGACAVLVAGALTGRLADEAILRLPGGDLRIAWQREATAGRPAGVYMTGPAAEVFRGSVKIP